MLKHSLRVGVAAATLAALTVAFVGGASAANLVQNGDFSSPGAESAMLLTYGSTFVTGWTVQDEYAAYIPQGQTADQEWNSDGFGGAAGPGYGVNNGLVGPPSGDAYMVIDGTDGFGTGGGFGWIEQSLSGLVSGQTYTLSFWQAGGQEIDAGGETTQMFKVDLGDQTVGTSPTMDVPSQGFSPWEEFSTTFTWDGVGNLLKITSVGTGEPPFAMLADVSLTGTTGGTPEASTWVMIVAGFAGIGLLARARRKVVAVA